MTGMLASVRNIQEAELVCRCGADIIDLKEPANGALGAISLFEIHRIVDELWEKCLISATTGDLPADPVLIGEQIKKTADTGVDYVKVGMFTSQHIEQCLPTFKAYTDMGIHLVIVFFADMAFELKKAIDECAKAGIKGVMFDTMIKLQGPLTKYKTSVQLQEFLALAKKYRLVTGLAGSLEQRDIPALLDLRPNYLGFRSALCRYQNRVQSIDPYAIEQVRYAIPRRIVTRKLA